MEIYSRLTDKMAGLWRWLYRNSETGFKALTNLLKVVLFLRRHRIPLIASVSIITTMFSLMQSTSDNPRWISLIVLSRQQWSTLITVSVGCLLILIISAFLSKLLADSARKYIHNEGRMPGK